MNERDDATAHALTAEQRLKVVEAETVERCAKVCENQVEDFRKHRNADGVQNGPDMFADEIDALIDVAALIRALKVEK